MPRTSSRLLGALLAAAVLATAACGSDPAPEADAQGLVVYSGRNENLVKPLLEEFTKATGVPVTARYGGSAELAAQLLEEGERTPASVFLSQDAGALGALQEADRLEVLPQAQLDRVPERYRSAKGAWVGVSGRSRVLVYNRDLVTPASLPKSVFELTGPAYRGKVAYAPTNASFQAFVTGMRVSVGEERTKAFLTAFKANGHKAYDGNIPIVAAVDSGQIAYGLVNHYYLYERAAEAGGLDALKARNHVFPGTDPGSLVNVAGVGVLKGKTDERATKLIDYLLSTPGQTYFADRTKEYALVAGVPSDLPGLPPLAQLEGPDVDLSELESLDETLALLDEVGLT